MQNCCWSTRTACIASVTSTRPSVFLVPRIITLTTPIVALWRGIFICVNESGKSENSHLSCLKRSQTRLHLIFLDSKRYISHQNTAHILNIGPSRRIFWPTVEDSICTISCTLQRKWRQWIQQNYTAHVSDLLRRGQGLVSPLHV